MGERLHAITLKDLTAADEARIDALVQKPGSLGTPSLRVRSAIKSLAILTRPPGNAMVASRGRGPPRPHYACDEV